MSNHAAEIKREKIDTINDLIQIARDSAEFYSEAANAVDNPKLKSLFAEMAQSKSGLVGAMSRQVREAGATPASSGTITGTFRRLYENARAKMRSDDGDFAYVSELENGEDRLMDAFHDVLASDSTPTEVKESLRGYMPTIKKHHDTMRDRKWAMQTGETKH